LNRSRRGSQALNRRIRRFFRRRVYESGGQVFFSSPWPRQLTLRGFGLTPRFDKKRHGARVFVTPFAWLGSFFSRPSRVSAIVVREPFGRMGNQTIQLVHAVAYAMRWSIDKALLPGNTILTDTTTLSNGLSVSPQVSDVKSVTASRAMNLTLSPGAPREHLVMNTYFSRELDTPFSDTEYAEAFDSIANVAPLAPTARALPERHLVIHLRGGDAFGPHPHMDYAQPPLAFYDLVLEHQAWAQVTIVRADDSHPLEAELVEKIRARSISVKFQSASAEEDAEFLARARSLVSSRGSFVPAIVGRSRHTTALYLFGDERRLRGNLDVYRVTDHTGEFWETCCRRNWHDTPQQRELMRSYPASELLLSHERR